MKKALNYEIISYIIFGVLTTLVDWIAYVSLKKLNVEYILATAIAFFAAVIFAFFTNKIWVFKSYSFKLNVLYREFISFLFARLATGAMNIIGMWLFVEIFNINDYVSKAILAILVIIINYVLSKLFIFKK